MKRTINRPKQKIKPIVHVTVNALTKKGKLLNVKMNFAEYTITHKQDPVTHWSLLALKYDKKNNKSSTKFD